MGFRDGFVWGAATASYQVEGAAFEGGKGRSIWDDFSHTPGKVYGDHNADVSCDHYHRFREDVALMKALGMPAYRFSVSWPRVLPEGVGEANEEGLRFYDELIDTLLESGIRPLVTLYHWDLPSALQKRGGWANPESPRWFADYAALVAKRFGARVSDYFTFNEPQCVVGLGNVMGVMAPGLVLPPRDTIPMSHHIHVAHGQAVERIREIAPNARIGFVGCGPAAIPASELPADVEAARQAYFAMPTADPAEWVWSASWWADPVMLGRYPEDGLTHFGQYLPRGFEKQLAVIGQQTDYYAHNYYQGDLYRAGGAHGFESVPWPAGHPRTANDWAMSPDTLYWGPRFLYERYKSPIFITENGMSAHDWVSLDGQVHDPQRIDYLHRYLLALRRAAQDGVDVYGYLAWSLLDNFEWHCGYRERFGLVHVDYQTLARTPKDSARWYAQVIRENGAGL
jgi:beta-glucosidase